MVDLQFQAGIKASNSLKVVSWPLFKIDTRFLTF